MFTYRRLTGYVRRSLPWLTFAAALLFTGSISFAQKARTWTDSTGKFTILGKLSSNDGTMVSIEKNDGKIISVPLDKLCKSDQFYLKRMAANPANSQRSLKS